MRIAERSVSSGKRGAPANGMPRLDPDASGCRVIANADGTDPEASAKASGDTRRIVGSLKDGSSADQEVLRRRVGQLEDELAKLKASHGAFLEQTAGLAAVRIGELERALSAVGVDAKSLSGEAARRGRKTEDEKSSLFGRGGPFIAAKRGLAPNTADGFNPVALFNTHADRLDNLTTAIKTLPLGEPLADYEVTSPLRRPQRSDQCDVRHP